MTIPLGTIVTVHRTTRLGPRSWTGVLLSIGTMSCGGVEMGRLSLRQEDGIVQHFAIDPFFDTIVTKAGVSR
jgi:hypothetical protein